MNATTAAHLRERMRRCHSLVYATSQNASTSRWMPWELGFFDGARGPERVAICPIETGTGNYIGQEYLGLYKTLEKVRDAGVLRPFVIRPSGREAERLRILRRGKRHLRWAEVGKPALLLVSGEANCLTAVCPRRWRSPPGGADRRPGPPPMTGCLPSQASS